MTHVRASLLARRVTGAVLVAVSVTFAGGLSAAATPTPSPSPSGTDGTGAPPISSVTAIPDYNLNPLRLEHLQSQLADAKAKAKLAKANYQTGLTKLAAAQAKAAAAQSRAVTAGNVAKVKHDQMIQLLVQEYENGPQVSPAVSLMLNPPTDGADPSAILEASSLMQFAADAQAAKVDAAVAAMNHAKALSAAAAKAQADAQAFATKLHTTYTTTLSNVRTLTTKVTAEIARVNAIQARIQTAEKVRDSDAVGRWRNYLTDLALAGVVHPPTAAQLLNPTHLPKGLSPLKDTSGHLQPGAAVKHTAHGDVLVLPKEVIAAVGSALSKLGLPYVFGAVGPTSYDCSGLTMSSYAAGGLYIPRIAADQYHFTDGAARIAPGQELPGDLIFFVGDDGTPTEPGHVGMVLDPTLHLFIQAPQTGDVVKISDYSTWPSIGFGRPSVLAQPVK